jgi:hypothetical protein
MITTIPPPRTTAPDQLRALPPSAASSAVGSSDSAKTAPPPRSDGASAEPARTPAPPPTPPAAPAAPAEHVEDCAAGVVVGGEGGKRWNEILLGSSPKKATASEEEVKPVVKCVVCLVGGAKKEILHYLHTLPKRQKGWKVLWFYTPVLNVSMTISLAPPPYTSEDFPAEDTMLGVMCGVSPPEGGTEGTSFALPLHPLHPLPPPPPRHFICGDGCNGCLGGHVRNRGESLRAVARLAVTAAAEETAGNIRRVNELEGLVHCPVPGCTSTHFSDFAIARHCEEPEVQSYLEGRRLLAVARAEAAVGLYSC